MRDRIRAQVLNARVRLAPWGGWIGGGAGWVLSHQIGSDLAQAKCGAADPLLMILIGLIGLGMALFGGLSSLAARRREVGGRVFVAYVGVLFALVLGIAIAMQTSAALILPRCFG